MSEKKIVVDGLRFSYSGPFDIIEFYKEAESWIRENGMEKEVKKKLEYVEEEGKKIEWVIECWKMQMRYAKTVVRLRALFTDVVNVQIAKDKSKRKLNNGNVLIVIDGFLESEFAQHWTMKPWYYFMRGITDKFFWPVWIQRFDKKVSDASYDLHHRLKSFFNLYRY